MKKGFLLFFIFALFLIIPGCHASNELETASNELSKNNYTVHYEVSRDVVFEKEHTTTKKEYLVKENGAQTLFSTWNDKGERFDVYTEIKDNKVEVLINDGDIWKFDRFESLDTYQKQVIIPRIDLDKRNFSYEQGKWLGKKDVINKQLESYFMTIADQYSSYPGFIDAEISTVVNEYSVELENKSISQIIFDYQVIITFPDQKELIISEYITADFYDINSTILSRPGNIFQLSYMEAELDNFTAEVTITRTKFIDEIVEPYEGFNYKVSLDGNKAIIVIPVFFDIIDYIEETEDGTIVKRYDADSKIWIETSDSAENLKSLCRFDNIPEIEYKQENFEYIDGYWHANVKDLNSYCKDYVDELKNTYEKKLLNREINIECSEYIIQIENNQPTKIITIANIITDDIVIVERIEILFSKINETVVEGPKLK